MDKDDVEIRPSIAITKAHMKLPELENSVRNGRLVPDGKICVNDTGELAVTKVAVEPVWYLPGIAERFGIGELHSVLLLNLSIMQLANCVYQTRAHFVGRYSKRPEVPILNSSPVTISRSSCPRSEA